VLPYLRVDLVQSLALMGHTIREVILELTIWE